MQILAIALSSHGQKRSRSLGTAVMRSLHFYPILGKGIKPLSLFARLVLSLFPSPSPDARRPVLSTHSAMLILGRVVRAIERLIG
jgi:hypothetical protein